MGTRKKDLVDRAYREARLSAFWGNIGDIRVVLAFLGLGVVVAAIMGALLSPLRFVAHSTGHLVGQFSHQGYTGPPDWIISVRLDNGGTVSLVMPKNETYRPDVGVKVDVYEQGFGPIKWNSYRFRGYIDAPNG